MTTPTVIITLDGGLVQDVSVTHQVNVVVLDLDTEGADKSDLTVLKCAPRGVCVSNWGSPICPTPETDVWIAQVLADIARDERP